MDGRLRLPSRLAVLGDDVGEDAAAHVPLGRDAHEAGRQCAHEVVQDFVGHGFVEFAFVAEAPGVELEALELDAELVRNIVDHQHGKVRLAGHRAQAGEFWHLDMDLEIPPGAGIGEGVEILAGLRRHELASIRNESEKKAAAAAPRVSCRCPFGIIRSIESAARAVPCARLPAGRRRWPGIAAATAPRAGMRWRRPVRPPVLVSSIDSFPSPF